MRNTGTHRVEEATERPTARATPPTGQVGSDGEWVDVLVPPGCEALRLGFAQHVIVGPHDDAVWLVTSEAVAEHMAEVSIELADAADYYGNRRQGNRWRYLAAMLARDPDLMGPWSR